MGRERRSFERVVCTSALLPAAGVRASRVCAGVLPAAGRVLPPACLLPPGVLAAAGVLRSGVGIRIPGWSELFVQFRRRPRVSLVTPAC